MDTRAPNDTTQRRTHCRRGHEFTPENTYVVPSGRNAGNRVCRTCHRVAQKRYDRKMGHKERPVYTMPDDPVVLAYAAGIIDGEGTIGIKLQANGTRKEAIYHTFKVRVANTDRRLVNWMQEQFGGSVSTSPRRARHRESYHWSIPSGMGAEFLRAIRPYLKLKGEQADIALALVATNLKDGTGAAGLLTPELYEHRESLRQKMLVLNQRGVQD